MIYFKTNFLEETKQVITKAWGNLHGEILVVVMTERENFSRGYNKRSGM